MNREEKQIEQVKTEQTAARQGTTEQTVTRQEAGEQAIIKQTVTEQTAAGQTVTEQITAEQRIVILQDVIPTMMEWYRRTARDLPWRERPEAYRVWISEIMLQQTRIEAVKPYYDRFLKQFPGVRELAEAPEEQVLKCWEGLGYYSRARNLQ